jgi:hypothetical protein
MLTKSEPLNGKPGSCSLRVTKYRRNRTAPRHYPQCRTARKICCAYNLQLSFLVTGKITTGLHQEQFFCLFRSFPACILDKGMTEAYGCFGSPSRCSSSANYWSVLIRNFRGAGFIPPSDPTGPCLHQIFLLKPHTKDQHCA